MAALFINKTLVVNNKDKDELDLERERIRVLENKVLLLYFGSGESPRCKAFAPTLKEFFVRLTDEFYVERSSQLVLIYISMDETEEKQAKFLKTMPKRWLFLPFHEEYKSTLVSHMTVLECPGEQVNYAMPCPLGSSCGAFSGPVEGKLADLLQAISLFLQKYPALNDTTSIQAAIASLIASVSDLNSQVKGTENKKRYSEIFRSLDALEISLGNAAVDTFMDEPNDDSSEASNPPPKSLQTEEICRCEGNVEAGEPANRSVEEADEMLIKCDGGVEAALGYAKLWCKYVKELLTWVDKRLAYGEVYFLIDNSHQIYHSLHRHSF
ncbi:hypothetical protein JRQ81_003760 [Phrynocephalus forsythii]|uniref:Thioredoxin-like fold domain-containing protein n=1 Tax=Phrynocephalus forsythii TaxID=171643 RepID=A0A9Q0XKG0_9SAUR|nr:hypothetical protein JRQ81_003760 [Phrynocephalus forsythii]